MVQTQHLGKWKTSSTPWEWIVTKARHSIAFLSLTCMLTFSHRRVLEIEMAAEVTHLQATTSFIKIQQAFTCLHWNMTNSHEDLLIIHKKRRSHPEPSLGLKQNWTVKPQMKRATWEGFRKKEQSWKNPFAFKEGKQAQWAWLLRNGINVSFLRFCVCKMRKTVFVFHIF